METVTEQALTLLTPEQYLEAERKGLRDTDGKYEYHNGKKIFMGGACKEHNKISTNISGYLWYQLQDLLYEIYHSDMRTYVPSRQSYYYPDIVVVQGEPQFKDNEFDNLLNPYLLVEIVSPSSSSYDRGDKFANYRGIASLQEYLVVSAQSQLVEFFQKVKENEWVLHEYRQSEDKFPLLSGQLTLSLSQIYRGLNLKD